jgi:hypothetical protein
MAYTRYKRSISKVTTTHNAHPFDYAGVETFREDLEENIKWLTKNAYLIPSHNYDFVISVLEFWKTREYLTDKQVNAILPAFRAAQDAEHNRKVEDIKDYKAGYGHQLDEEQIADSEALRELDGKPKFR